MEVDETRQDAEEAVRHIHSNRLGHVLEADGDSRLVDWLDGQTPAWIPDRLLRPAGEPEPDRPTRPVQREPEPQPEPPVDPNQMSLEL